MPVYEWFFDRLGDQARRELTDFCRQTDFLDPDEVGRLLAAGNGTSAWVLLNFALWWKHFIA